MNEFLTAGQAGNTLTISLRNNWLFGNVPDLQSELAAVEIAGCTEVRFECSGLREIDLAGAWALYDKSLDFEELGYPSEFDGFQAGHFKFLRHIIDVAAVNEYDPDFFKPVPRNLVRHQLEKIGAATLRGFEAFGYISQSILDGTKKPSLLVVGETIRQMFETGARAIPIVMVLTFLMGVVLAY
ncbi:MAG: hypothetical protein ACREO9_12040, partial [Lysobacterales bacterium]